LIQRAYRSLSLLMDLYQTQRNEAESRAEAAEQKCAELERELEAMRDVVEAARELIARRRDQHRADNEPNLSPYERALASALDRLPADAPKCNHEPIPNAAALHDTLCRHCGVCLGYLCSKCGGSFYGEMPIDTCPECGPQPGKHIRQTTPLGNFVSHEAVAAAAGAETVGRIKSPPDVGPPPQPVPCPITRAAVLEDVAEVSRAAFGRTYFYDRLRERAADLRKDGK
jgi:hypothetical protein